MLPYFWLDLEAWCWWEGGGLYRSAEFGLGCSIVIVDVDDGNVWTKAAILRPSVVVCLALFSPRSLSYETTF